MTQDEKIIARVQDSILKIEKHTERLVTLIPAARGIAVKANDITPDMLERVDGAAHSAITMRADASALHYELGVIAECIDVDVPAVGDKDNP